MDGSHHLLHNQLPRHLGHHTCKPLVTSLHIGRQTSGQGIRVPPTKSTKAATKSPICLKATWFVLAKASPSFRVRTLCALPAHRGVHQPLRLYRGDIRLKFKANCTRSAWNPAAAGLHTILADAQPLLADVRPVPAGRLGSAVPPHCRPQAYPGPRAPITDQTNIQIPEGHA